MSESDYKSDKQASGQGLLSSVLALLLSLAAVSLSAYLWYTLAYQNADLYSQSIPQRVQALRKELNQLKTASDKTSKSVEELRSGQKVLTEATRKAYTDFNKDRNKWAISEIEQLLIIANQRMQLAHDFETAAIALQAADSRLQALADPSLMPVRKRLASEINRIKSIERSDLSGLALRLGSLIDDVEKLPLSLEVTYNNNASSGDKNNPGEKNKPELVKKIKNKTNTNAAVAKPGPKTGPPKESKAPSRPGFFAELWQDILGLVRIRDNAVSYKPLLLPEQQYFLRENLRLLLLGAQQALLRDEKDIYVHNLKSAKRWVNKYFDTHTQAIRHLNSELDALTSTKLIQKSPDISGSLALLRKLSQGSGLK